MKSTELAKELIDKGGFSKTALAREITGKPDAVPTYVSNMLNRDNGMRIDKFVALMNAMGYKVVVTRGKEEYEVTE